MTRRTCPLQAHASLVCTEVLDTEVDDGARVLVRRALLSERPPLAIGPREHTGRGGSGGGSLLLPCHGGWQGSMQPGTIDGRGIVTRVLPRPDKMRTSAARHPPQVAQDQIEILTKTRFRRRRKTTATAREQNTPTPHQPCPSSGTECDHRELVVHFSGCVMFQARS